MSSSGIKELKAHFVKNGTVISRVLCQISGQHLISQLCIPTVIIPEILRCAV